MTKRGKPMRLRLAGQMYKAVVLQVTRRENGAPREFRLLDEHENVKIEGGEEFVVVFGSEKVFSRPKPN